MNRQFQYQRIILGYHGCDKKVADMALLKKAALRSSENDYDWLGKGIYFWEHGPERALEWAQHQGSLGKIEKPAVIGAVIHLGVCFDLLDRDATAILRDLSNEFFSEMEQQGKALPENIPAYTGDPDCLLRKLDCAVINWVLGMMDSTSMSDSYDSVRGLFQEDEPVYEGSSIRLKSHIQIAIRNPACILGYFDPS